LSEEFLNVYETGDN